MGLEVSTSSIAAHHHQSGLSNLKFGACFRSNFAPIHSALFLCTIHIFHRKITHPNKSTVETLKSQHLIPIEIDSDDDFEVFTPSPVDPAPKMKRLKKLSRGVLKENAEIDEVEMDVAVVTLPGDDETADVDFGGAGDLEMESGDLDGVMRSERELHAKRALDFGAADGGGNDENLGEADLEMDQADMGFDVDKGKGKEKRKKGDGGEEMEGSGCVSKKRSEKERREYLNQLHAESQRLLRETRDAGFKPAPAVHKPISSVLEKIRKRKLELQKNTYNVDDDVDCEDLEFCEGVLNPKSENIHLGGKTGAELPGQVNEGNNRDTREVDCSLKEASVNRNETTEEELASSLRAPICDTQELFCDSEANDSKNETASPSEENFVPSILAMNLRFNSALPDDDDDVDNDDDDDEYSDEEDNDKENVVPHQPMLRSDPVQAFVDDEAVEEDDSDNDQSRFKENEDEEDTDEDAEDINEMIANDCEENQIDQERRQELHMKMLEQQDAEGIENLLQKYKCESKVSKSTVLKEKDNIQEDESYGDALETEAPKSSLRLFVKKAKQMIAHMFSDNEDVYVSSEDEQLDTKIVNRVFKKSDEKKKVITPDQDKSSREVFGLIKKLNIASEMKKKTKFSSFDVLTSKNISSSKTSFLHRTTSSSLSSSRKHGSSVTRAFVFARDDSNGRSSVAVSEYPDTIQNEVQPIMRSTVKFSQSQSKLKLKESAENVAGSSSLFEMLRRSAVQSHNEDGMVGRTDTVFASFKLPKRTKIEGKLYNS